MRSFGRIRAVLTVISATAIAGGILAAPALAAPAAAGVPASANPAKVPLSAAQLRADRKLHDIAGASTLNSIAGLARGATGAPLGDVCVTAASSSVSKSAVTMPDGRFLIGGLRPGTYQVKYSSCAGAASRYLPEWYGGVLQRGESRSVIVTGSTLEPVQTLAPVTLYPADSSLGDLPDAVVPQHGSDQLAADPFGPLATAPSGPAALIKSLVARYGQVSGAASAAASGRGRIAGVVTSTSGQPLAGICVEAAAANGSAAFALATTGKNGSYRTGSLPAGRYLLVIFPECGNQGNWLVQIYKGIYNPEKNPTLVRIRAGQTTGKINVVMKQGGEISGTVTGPKGKKLSSVCVDPLSNSPDLLFFTGISHDGTYHIRSVPPGSYQIGFAPCGTADYAPTLWPGTQNYATAPFIKIRGSRHVSNINQVMQLGGIIKGTVTSATTPAAPLAGICVLVSENNGLFENGSAATSATGSYEVKGLATGSYSVQFQTGCDNNGNYVGISYPANVAVTAGSASSGIDGSLPVGATISGTVTSAASGQPLAGVCVEIEGVESGAGGEEITGPDGTYSVNQLPVDTYQAYFSGGCGGTGSYAPQAYDNTNVLEPQNIDVTAAGQDVTGISAAMRPGPVIAGTVTGASGKPLSGICVFAGTASGVLFAQSQTVGGQYQLPDLDPGLYEVIFSPGCGDNADLAEEAFRSQLNGTAVDPVSAVRGTVNGINAVMEPAGGISGVVRAATGRHVEFACILLAGISGSAASLSGSAELYGSTYELTGLPTGGYQVAFAPSCAGSGLQTQWYKDKPTPDGAATVEVTSSHLTTGVSSDLVSGGSIAGQVTSAGDPVHDMCVYAQNVVEPDDFGYSISNRNGYYDVHGLNSGNYELELFSCGNASDTLAEEIAPQLVHVTAPRRTSGVQTSVPAGATINGTVVAGSPATGQGAAGACVEAYSLNGAGFNAANAALDGTFSLTNLPPGQYQVYVGDPACSFSEPSLAPQWYLDQASLTRSTIVTVSAGGTTTLSDSTLVPDGSVSGKVTGTGGAPLAGVCVAAIPTGAAAIPVYSVTGSTGRYTVGDLPAGPYRVKFSSGCDAAGYLTQWWNGKPTRRTATIVTVSSGAATTGISARLRS